MSKTKLLATSMLICGAVFALSTGAHANPACYCVDSSGSSCMASSHSGGGIACIGLCSKYSAGTGLEVAGGTLLGTNKCSKIPGVN